MGVQKRLFQYIYSDSIHGQSLLSCIFGFSSVLLPSRLELTKSQLMKFLVLNKGINIVATPVLIVDSHFTRVVIAGGFKG